MQFSVSQALKTEETGKYMGFTTNSDYWFGVLSFSVIFWFCSSCFVGGGEIRGIPLNFLSPKDLPTDGWMAQQLQEASEHKPGKRGNHWNFRGLDNLQKHR